MNMTRNSVAARWLLTGLLALPVAAMAGSPGGDKILIINSDSSVEKYRQAESGFRQGAAAPNRTLTTLALEGREPADIGRLIEQAAPDLIYGIGSKALQLAIPAAGERPLLFSSVINWERFGQGKNRYGIANELSLSQELAYLRYLLPERKRIGFVYDPRYNQERITEARRLIQENRLESVEQTVGQPAHLGKALENLLPRIDLLWLMADPGVLVDRQALETIFAAAVRHQKPVYTYSEAMVPLGASVVVAADDPTVGRQAAHLARAILARTPATPNIQVPAGSRITLNTCQLDKLGVPYNEDALDAVNQLIKCR
jgi:putative ABC transport system substrate-binding protein